MIDKIKLLCEKGKFVEALKIVDVSYDEGEKF